MKNLTRIALFLTSIPALAGAPEWTQATGRQVVGGDVIHWGTGESETSETALFKAHQMAIHSLMEDCGGFAHKAIIPRKQYVESHPRHYVAYATMSIDFDSCEYGKKKNPNKDLENKEILAGQKTYHDLMFGGSEAKKAVAEQEIKKAAADRRQAELDRELINQDVDSMHSEIEALKIDMIVKANAGPKPCDKEVAGLLKGLKAQAEASGTDIYSLPGFQHYDFRRIGCLTSIAPGNSKKRAPANDDEDAPLTEKQKNWKLGDEDN